MAVFVVIVTDGPATIRAEVIRQYGAAHFELANNVWLVHDVGVSRSVADKLGLTDGALGSQGVVMSAANYYGYTRSDTWTWLQQFPDVIPSA